MLCPMTDNGPREMTRLEFNNECIEIQKAGDCLICEKGRLARMGLKEFDPPEDVTFIDAKKETNAPVKKTDKAGGKTDNNGFPGDDRLKPIPVDVLRDINVVGLKPYWKKAICKCGVPGICVNCIREINICSAGLCSRCNQAGAGLIGKDCVDALTAAAKRPVHGPRKKVKPAAAPQSSGGGQPQGPTAAKEPEPPKQQKPWEVMPKNKWQRQRLGDLALAVHMHVVTNRFGEPCVAEWCKEIQEILSELTSGVKQ